MNYLPRPLILEQLKLSLRQSYRIVPPSYGALINSDEVLHIVNEARRGIREPLTGIPDDVLTAEQLAGDPALGGVLSPARLIKWTHRKRNIPPHFRFNKKTTRFPRRQFFDWLTAQSHIRNTKTATPSKLPSVRDV